MIGLATTLHLYLFRRIIDAGDTLNTLSKLSTDHNGHIWKLFMAMGFMTFPYLMSEVEGGTLDLGFIKLDLFDSFTGVYSHTNGIGWFVGGFLIGFGSAMAGNSLAGHTMIPMLSLRSILATILSVACAIGMATLRYYVPFIQGSTPANLIERQDTYQVTTLMIMVLLVAFCLYSMYRNAD